MHDKIITEIPLIRRYSRHNENQDLRFGQYLLSLNVSNQSLDTIVQETTERVWMGVDCLKCANCCKSLEVVVDKKDMLRLSNRLKISPRAFQQKYIGLVENNVSFLRGQPCVFLGPDNKCAVYEDRPQACRDFPYLHDKGFRNRTLIMIAKLGVCPIVFNVWRQLKKALWSIHRAKT